MENNVNRVAGEMESWRKREERFIKLFPDTLTNNRVFQLEKLANLEAIAIRYKGSLHPDERLTLRILKEQKKDLEKKLYANRLYRLVRRIIVTAVIRSREQKRVAGTAESVEQVKDLLQKAGLGHLSPKLDQQVKIGSGNLSVPATIQINEKERLDYEVRLQHNADGRYTLSGYQAALHSNGPELRKHLFTPDNGSLIAPQEAYQLLAGRALLQHGEWIQFDLNDKDASGNYRIRHFPKEAGFELDELIGQFKIDETRHNLSDLQKGLAEGKKMEVRLKGDALEQTVFIEANPQSKSLNIYDASGKKITMDAALNGKANGKVVELKPNQAGKDNLKRATGRKL